MSRVVPSPRVLLRRMLWVLAVGAACVTGAAMAAEGARAATRVDSTYDYVVEPGDTLWSIAEAMLGRWRAWPRLQRYNRLEAAAPLRPLRRLRKRD